MFGINEIQDSGPLGEETTKEIKNGQTDQLTTQQNQKNTFFHQQSTIQMVN
jgi:hypothetical protein